MSRKTRKNRSRTRTNAFDPDKLFSKKEFDILKEELADEDAANRHNQPLATLFLSNPLLKSVLIPMPQIMPVVSEIQKRLRAETSLAGTSIDESGMGKKIIEQIVPLVDVDYLSNALINAIKEIKIKHEKRMLLWAFGELAVILGNKKEPSESLVVQIVAVTSVQYGSGVIEEAKKIIHEEPPYEFSAERILDGSLQEDDFDLLFSNLVHFEPHLSALISISALALFELIKRPFGLRFHQIIHYPIVAKTKQRLIVVPGKTENDEPEESEIERMQKLNNAWSRDMNASNSLDAIKQILRDIKTAAFGDVDPEALRVPLNAAAFCLLFPVSMSPFLLEFYEKSGQNAEQINPEDEVNLIVEMKHSPEDAGHVRRYADLLYEKKKWKIAFQVYNRYLDMIDKPDEDLKARFEQLFHKIIEEADAPNPETDAPPSTLISS